MSAVVDFPKPGGTNDFRTLLLVYCAELRWPSIRAAVRFWDVTSLMVNPAVFQDMIDELVKCVRPQLSRTSVYSWG